MHPHRESTRGGNIVMQQCLPATDSAQAGGHNRAMDKEHYKYMLLQTLESMLILFRAKLPQPLKLSHIAV
jgi:hypothetical protein